MGTRDEGLMTVQHSKKNSHSFPNREAPMGTFFCSKPDMLTEVLMCQYLKLFKNIFQNKSCDS